MKKNFSDINVEISQILNRAMYAFDEMPGSSRSVLADSASRDLSGISVNFKFFRLLAFALLAMFLWKMKDFSIALDAGSVR
ncbi:hypothetical protein ACO0LC_13995 [Undibacterium sp. JH2W]|uniref:hypothetical protein n=1 Tax=Undibacterium sp. JH2W TaxID=3413037 RepID=UPI003BF1F0A0